MNKYMCPICGEEELIVYTKGTGIYLKCENCNYESSIDNSYRQEESMYY